MSELSYWKLYRNRFNRSMNDNIAALQEYRITIDEFNERVHELGKEFNIEYKFALEHGLVTEETAWEE